MTDESPRLENGTYKSLLETEVTEEEVYEKMTEKDMQALAASLLSMDGDSSSIEALSLESSSAWGSSIALPQIARSMNYDTTFTLLAMRTLLTLYVTVSMQMLLLVYIGESTQIMAPLGGQMHLCDFGGALDDCPGGDHCMGPGGTNFTKDRIYGFTQWTIQNFVRNAFLAINPKDHDFIAKKIDPGEYGIESMGCRFLCIALFVMSVIEELQLCWNLARLIYSLPSDTELNWVQFSRRGPSKASMAQTDAQEPLADESPSTTTGKSPHYRYRIAGMPIGWKVFNACFMLAPKCVIMHYVLREGTVMLMDTAAIMDMILGAMSMSFLLNVDETIYVIFASTPAKHIMGKLKPFNQNSQDKSDGKVTWEHLLRTFFPVRAVIVAVIMIIYVKAYYYTKCQQVNGQWVSKDMFTPKTSDYHMFDFIFDTFFQTVKRSSQPFWTMPGA